LKTEEAEPTAVPAAAVPDAVAELEDNTATGEEAILSAEDEEPIAVAPVADVVIIGDDD